MSNLMDTSANHVAFGPHVSTNISMDDTCVAFVPEKDLLQGEKCSGSGLASDGPVALCRDQDCRAEDCK